MDTSGLIGPQPGHAILLNDSFNANRVSWDASRTGTGKTFVACSILKNQGKKFVVICPKLAIPQWEECLKQFGIKAEWIINYEKLCRGNTPWLKFRKKIKDVPRFLRVNLKIPLDWVIILDESQKCKGIESLQAGILFDIKRKGYQAHLMSATQAANPMDMRAFGYLTDLHNGEMADFKDWCITAGAEWKGKWGAQFFNSENSVSMEKLRTVHHLLFDFKKVGHCLTREDFGDIFPDVQNVVEAYDMGNASDKIRHAYEDMEYELDELERKCEAYANHILAVITKTRRKVELLKVPTMIEMGLDLYAEGRSVLFFVNYTDTIVALYERLCQHFKPELIGKIYGEQTYTNKLADMRGFQADQKRFMVINQAAGGVSINLHDLNGIYPRASVYNPSYSAINIIQCCGRTDRAYAKTDVYNRFLYAARTIEEDICRRWQSKKDFIDMLNDGDLVPNQRIFKFAHGLAV